jgi:sugar/nucleoside kinase (ribokinase family)
VSTIAVFGNVQADVIVNPAAALPDPGTDVLVEDVSVRAAGSAGNTALALRDAGREPRLYGVVGDDAFGELIRAELARHGLGRDVAVAAGRRTGVSVCLEAPGRDRAFWTYWGCLTGQRAEDAPAWVTAAGHGLYCGYFTLPAARGRPTLDLLTKARGMTLFDCGWDLGGWSAATRTELAPILAATDVFLPNAAEATGVTGIADPYAATRELQRRYGGWVATKLGADGGCAAGPHGAWHTAPAPRVHVTDTTGAGDAFNAGLTAALADGAPWPAALRTAVDLASEIVSRPSHRRYPVRP